MEASQERLAEENELLRAKVENLATASRLEEQCDRAIAVMRSYGGHDPIEQPKTFDV